MPLECAHEIMKLPVPAPRQGNATHYNHLPGNPGSVRTQQVGREGAWFRGGEHAGPADGEGSGGAVGVLCTDFPVESDLPLLSAAYTVV